MGQVRVHGDHLLREPHVAVREAGLVIDEMARSKWGIVTRPLTHKTSQPQAADLFVHVEFAGCRQEMGGRKSGPLLPGGARGQPGRGFRVSFR